ncbi:MAG TPA: DNA polymerase III subunit epsilon [Burkholderiales bacterium]|jgi:DNA polymerase-3 subunit epsilon|nr:DNA polymerase III subunit epsilon [Burkholderiales bacterium]
MRQIVLDTETTGLDPALGHRIIELAAVEIVNRRITDKVFHRYLNPEREIEDGALQVHGITGEFLADKPRFRDVARDFLEFIDGAELIIHNAAFDLAFLNAELALLKLEPVEAYCHAITDTLRMAKDLHPGKRNSLDALCERYAIDNSSRTLHGALLDARLLAEVYLAITRGQDSLLMDVVSGPGPAARVAAGARNVELIVVRATPEELDLHRARLEDIDKASRGGCIWKKLEPAASQIEAGSGNPNLDAQRA